MLKCDCSEESYHAISEITKEFEKQLISKGIEVRLKRERDILDSDMNDHDLCIALGKCLVLTLFLGNDSTFLRAAGVIGTEKSILGVNVLPKYINGWLLGAKIN